MKKYKTLLFDVDNTLLDFDAAESAALRLLCENQRISFTTELETRYKKINKGLWRAFEEGKLDRDELLNTRFSMLFKEYGHEADGVVLEGIYREFLSEGNQLIEGALELAASLQDHFDLYIVTNGVSRTQEKRLRGSGLHPLFKGIFVSEDTGYQKPMKEYFDYVFARIPNFSLEHGLIIGDSLNADMKGGQMAGLDTCWYNPNKNRNSTDTKPAYEIQRLDELYSILGIKKHVV
ncbi:YjjG family noncanonical pyrimidine nucleotidase [Fictibacillus terranigra]|uniref:YjjG family noncanonical pyrimidine nucleotidase n=1 Tax=Fictibacillus terranigra TaxID=3058424 RepID=A0ABT8E833_9BACL|nr:YjjG family noncanonical pyrimidine nucleotidase [Fictibacillus sp. CENA-BCM004]MDN4074078.1 YjjG family noncanonical pyrimidine nucleotidase [Fictibacillus sp. CENA-BCM004]